jgi:glycine reductase complex component B subunit gamma
MIVVHYLNQFFAGLGGEEAAGQAPARIGGAVGPGRGLEAAGLPIDVTLTCGDDFFGEHEPEALARLLSWLGEIDPDVLVCGPSFGSGRYGYACGSFAREAGRRGIPVVGAMTPDNPGVLAAEGAAYIVPTGPSVASMKTALPAIARLAHRLGSGEPVGNPAEDGYLPRGLRKNVRLPEAGADRAIAALLAKLSGNVWTEAGSAFDRVTPPPAIGDLGSCTLALVTEAGCVPRGNPDHLPSRHSNIWLRYPLSGVGSLSPTRYESVHAGFDTRTANLDPNRLVPLDAVRTLEREGRIGRLHAFFYTTAGVDTPMAVAAKFGQEIASELIPSGVQAVILTGT